jgi:subtilase family serine protease
VKRGPVGAVVVAALSLGALALIPMSSGGSVPALARVSLRGQLPTIPADVARLGAVPANQAVHLSVALAGQDPDGLAAEVAAVSTPGSPDFHHYLTAAEFASRYGPTPAEAQQVASALRAEGLTVGTAPTGSTLLPVSGRAAAVSAAFGTPLESVRLPGQGDSLVNLADPQVPAALARSVTAVIGLDGLARPHSMLRRATTLAAGPAAAAAASAASVAQPHALTPDAVGPQACAAANSAAGASGHTSAQLAADYGLSQLYSQGRTGIGQTIAVVEFEQYSVSDIDAFESCYGLDNPVRTITVDGTPLGSPAGSGESALDIEMTAASAPSASILVYEAPNENNDASALDLLNQIATDDLAQTVTTSWGICEQDNTEGNAATENDIFSRMAVQGQTMVAASGDSGSEDCYDTDGGTELAVDDPGSQPDVVSAGGTSLSGGDVAAQAVWNNCGHSDGEVCQNENGNGAGGGGYSALWSRPSWQPATTVSSATDGCGAASGCRSVPDLSADADPQKGVVAYFASDGGWTVFGGTSAVAPQMAGLFADTDQGCTTPLGMVGPALYAAAGSANFTDVTTGQNDFTATNGGRWPATAGYDAASGLGTPVAQNLAIALQGGDGCPSVAGLSTQAGPDAGGGVITITGGGLADATAVDFGSAGQGQIVSASETSLTVMPPSASQPTCVDVTVVNPQGISATSAADRYGFGASGLCQGYRFVASDGGIFDYGSAAFAGSTGNIALARPIVGMATTPSGNGYWLVASDGGVFTFGDARFFGSTGNLDLKAPIVGMAATPDGGGYWLVASDGGIFTFGDANFFGSEGSAPLNRPIVGMAATPDGGGYWLVASDGGIFTFGDAGYFGSTGNIALNRPIVGMAPTPDGGGYWLAASDGGIFSFGDAQFYGSTGNLILNRPIVGMAAA